MTLLALIQADARLSARLTIPDRPGVLRTLASLLAHSGDSPLWLAGLSITIWLGNDFWRHQALAGVAGILLAAMIVFALKFSIRRRRPEGEWGAIYRRLDAHSFPSGHAARMAMLAALAVRYGPPAWAVLLAIWAVLVMLARVAMKVHYVSDVAAGAGLGAATGVVVALVLGS